MSDAADALTDVKELIRLIQPLEQMWERTLLDLRKRGQRFLCKVNPFPKQEVVLQMWMLHVKALISLVNKYSCNRELRCWLMPT